MNKNLLVIAGLFAVSIANAQLYNNATPAGLTLEGLRTGPRGAGGDYSEVQLGNTVAGFGVGGTGLFRLADNFSVSGGDWAVTSIDVFAYNTGATTPTITTGAMEVRSGSEVGAVVGTGTFSSGVFTDIYRHFNGAPGDARRVQKISFSYSGADLLDGQGYWVTYNVGNPGNTFTPFNPGLTKVGATTTPGANAKQFNAGTWAGIVDTGGTMPQDLPFHVYGTVVPEPISMLALVAGIAAMARKRRK